MLPFTRQQFFDVFSAYNSATWPVAIVVYPLGMLALFVVWRRTGSAGRVVGIVLAVMWGWVGVIYQGVYFRPINPVASAFAGAFVLQAALFALHAATGRGLEFGPRSQLRAVVGASMIVYAVAIYPLIGLAVGERYPAIPLFGVAPCPLLIFTFGLIVWASCVRWWLWVVPLLWSLIGGSAAIVLSVPQDWALPVTGILALLITYFDRVAPWTVRS